MAQKEYMHHQNLKPNKPDFVLCILANDLTSLYIIQFINFLYTNLFHVTVDIVVNLSMNVSIYTFVGDCS